MDGRPQDTVAGFAYPMCRDEGHMWKILLTGLLALALLACTPAAANERADAERVIAKHPLGTLILFVLPRSLTVAMR